MSKDNQESQGSAMNTSQDSPIAEGKEEERFNTASQSSSGSSNHTSDTELDNESMEDSQTTVVPTYSPPPSPTLERTYAVGPGHQRPANAKPLKKDTQELY